ncbi:MAG: rhomboid family intramembrane serine protease [Phycisphaerales bacterium]|nr:rhomboid family intramembrane serine protease [Phycisphaerales bacterium]
MGIADRQYYGDDERARMVHGVRLVSFNTWIIIINCAVFLLQVMSPSLGGFIFNYGHFSTYFVIDGHHLEFWRLITFQFLHGSIMHLVFNMLGLYMFGELVERQLGFKKYAAFYLVCGIFGGLMYLALNLLGTVAASAGVYRIPGLLYPEDASTILSKIPLIGASAGVFGVIMASAFIAPNAVVNLLIPPIPLKLRTFAYGYVGIAFISVLIGARNAGGEAAHIGGALAGYFFIRRAHLLTDFFDVFTDSRKSGTAKARLQPAPKRGGGGGSGGGVLSKLTGRGVPSQEEVNRILDKVRNEGLASLSEREKETLRRATEAERGG